jgi:hypothetical protein
LFRSAVPEERQNNVAYRQNSIVACSAGSAVVVPEQRCIPAERDATYATDATDATYATDATDATTAYPAEHAVAASGTASIRDATYATDATDATDATTALQHPELQCCMQIFFFALLAP